MNDLNNYVCARLMVYMRCMHFFLSGLYCSILSAQKITMKYF